jgi:cell wall-associated NlpC family hydrolase
VIQVPDARGPLSPTLRPTSGGAASIAPLGGTASGAITPTPSTISSGRSARIIPDLPATPAGARIITLAQTFVGARYTWGGISAATGFDCSGLIYHVFRNLGYSIGRTVEEQFTAGRPVRLDELRPGDLLFYQNTYIHGLSHDGIYIGGGRFVHAVDEASGVAITAVNSAYWDERYIGARRIAD